MRRLRSGTIVRRYGRHMRRWVVAALLTGVVIAALGMHCADRGSGHEERTAQGSALSGVAAHATAEHDASTNRSALPVVVACAAVAVILLVLGERLRATTAAKLAARRQPSAHVRRTPRVRPTAPTWTRLCVLRI